MRNRRSLVTALCIILSLASFAQQPAFVKDSLDAYINRGLKDWNIPGLAIAVVKDGKVVVMKGYGVKDIETKEPVDENTLFFIASNSKLFTGTALAQLDYNKKISLDDKITKYFTDFQLYDSTSTQLVTIKDMLGHHLGTKTFQGDFTFWNSDFGRQQIMYKMRLLKPSRPFRTSFGYCNSCFLTAGEVIPAVTGKPWEVYVYDSIIQPIGMNNTHTLTQGASERENVAKPYTNAFTGNLVELPYDHIDNIGPAASIVSNVSDLSKWLLLQLDSGRINNKQIIAWPVIQKTRDMQTIISSRKNALFPTHMQGYGLGVFVGDYNGKQVYWHTGGAFGFVTNTCFVPEENLGITILTNNDNQAFFEALRYQILDAYLGVPYTNRSMQQIKYFKPSFDETVNQIKQLQARVKGNKPQLALEQYTGIYSNELFGNIEIKAKGNDLIVDFKDHQKLSATLQYMDKNEWLLSYKNIAYGIFPIQFATNNNKVQAVTIKANDEVEFDPYTFIKQ